MKQSAPKNISPPIIIQANTGRRIDKSERVIMRYLGSGDPVVAAAG